MINHIPHITAAIGQYVLCDPYETQRGYTDNSFTMYPIYIISVSGDTVRFLDDARPGANLHIRKLPLAKFTCRKWHIVSSDYAAKIRSIYNRAEYIATFKERKQKVLNNFNKVI